MSDLDKLRELLSLTKSIEARVVKVSGLTATVTTPTGRVNVSTRGDVKIGDIVKVANGSAFKQKRGGTPTVYYV